MSKHSVHPTRHHKNRRYPASAFSKDRHPLVPVIAANHDQISWSITSDGLICAPVGYYRLVNIYDNDKTEHPRLAIVFGFDPKDLDLEGDPQHPERKTLRRDAYILPPIENDLAVGCAENAMKAHQQDWLTFALDYSNLYPQKRDDGDYYVNALAAYRVFPTTDEDGSIVSYSISFRVNPYNKKHDFGFNQHLNRSLSDRLFHHGIVLKTDIVSHDEALRYIHNDYHKRYSAFLQNEAVQLFDDPQRLRGAVMWLRNLATDMEGRPLELSSMVSELSGYLFSKPPITRVISELQGRKNDEDAFEEANEKRHPNGLRPLAEVGEGSAAPLAMMKEGVRERCAALSKAETQAFMYKPIPDCTDLKKHCIIQNVKLSSGLDVTIQVSAEDPAVALAKQGLMVLKIDSKRLLVGYSPDHAAHSNGNDNGVLPAGYECYFAEGKIVVIDFVHDGEKPPANAKPLYDLPHDSTRQAYISLQTDQEIRQQNPAPSVAEFLRRHKHPQFHAAADELLQPAYAEQTPVLQPQTRFRRIAESLTQRCKTAAYYARLLHPFVDVRKARDMIPMTALFLGGVIAQSQVLGDSYVAAAPCAFAWSASYMMRRMAANALSLEHKKYFETSSSVLRTLGPASFVGLESVHLWQEGQESKLAHYYQTLCEHRDRLSALKHVDVHKALGLVDTKELGETALCVYIAAQTAFGNLKATVRNGRELLRSPKRTPKVRQGAGMQA